MRNYEVTFIVDPVLSGDEVKATAQKYVDQLQGNNCSIVHVDEMGLRKLAYEINKRHSGYYYCVEFQSETGEALDPMELTLRRDDSGQVLGKPQRATGNHVPLYQEGASQFEFIGPEKAQVPQTGGTARPGEQADRPRVIDDQVPGRKPITVYGTVEAYFATRIRS